MFLAGSLGRSTRVCSVLYVRDQSSITTSRATADKGCSELPSFAPVTPNDRQCKDIWNRDSVLSGWLERTNRPPLVNHHEWLIFCMVLWASRAWQNVTEDSLRQKKNNNCIVIKTELIRCASRAMIHNKTVRIAIWIPAPTKKNISDILQFVTRNWLPQHTTT